MSRPLVRKLRRHIAQRLPREQLVDDFLESYVTWREACSRVASTYRRWVEAPRGDRTLAFAAYTSALDCEEQAAGTYRRLSLLVQESAPVPRAAARPRR